MKKLLNENRSSIKNAYKAKKLLLTVILFIILVVGGIFLLRPNVPTTPSAPVQMFSPVLSFSIFVEGWNDKVRAFDLAEAHLLSSTDSEQMLRSLKKYINDFSSPIPKNVGSELQRISHAFPSSIWVKYEGFLTAYTGKKKNDDIDWGRVSSSEDIGHLIQKTTKNSDYDESIKLILASSDPCAYFSLYRYDLYKQGLSRNFKECDVSIVDVSKYPALAALIR